MCLVPEDPGLALIVSSDEDIGDAVSSCLIESGLSSRRARSLVEAAILVRQLRPKSFQLLVFNAGRGASPDLALLANAASLLPELAIPALLILATAPLALPSPLLAPGFSTAVVECPFDLDEFLGVVSSLLAPVPDTPVDTPEVHRWRTQGQGAE